ncbi:glycosyl transferase [Salinimicrobium marinum]|uniref:Glycosyl transferase n=1 Tax=Salinimicrobium marinum TaxID=680283 RepID=A0A918SK94_9FLAO|nr:glycosyltransferase [Salinimicrobium marinum]GHA50325.1 glycosyl transferase [Salinimicrobium marinum]
MRFTVITYIEHKAQENSFYSYGPYMREMNLWFNYVDEVEVVAPLSNNPVQSAELAYSHKKLLFTKIPAINLLSGKSAFLGLTNLPEIFLNIFLAMKRSDHIHLRCPGNIGLIACIVQIFFPKKPKTVKYAGNWEPKAEQPWSYNLQKWILNNTFLTRNMQVLVYGEWPHQSKNIKPFFTASFSEIEKRGVEEKNFEAPFIFLYVGNLVPGKHPLKAIQLVQKINRELNKSTSREARAIKLKVYGDGPEMKMLKAYCRDENIEQLVDFEGSRPLEELKRAYKQSHFLILPSQSEGWPKAVAEAMFFGCVPISTPVSCVPWMLDYGSRGILISEKEKSREQRNRVEDVEKIVELMAIPEKMRKKSEAAKEWSQKFTLERFEGAIKEVLRKN